LNRNKSFESVTIWF